MFTQFTRKHQPLGDNKGMALVTVLVVSTALALAGNAFLATNGYEAGAVNQRVVQEQHFWAAESGIEYAKGQLKTGSNWTTAMNVWPKAVSAQMIDGVLVTSNVTLRNPSVVSNSGHAYVDSTSTAGGVSQTVTLEVFATFGNVGNLPYNAALCGCKNDNAAVYSVNFSGNSLIDSYFSSNGAYNAATAGDMGDVGSNGSLFMSGNTNVRGELIAKQKLDASGNVIATQNVTAGGAMTSGGNDDFKVDAIVGGNTSLTGNAYIRGNLQGGGNLSGQANCKIYGNAQISGNASAWSGTVVGGITTGTVAPATPPDPCNCTVFDVAALATAAAASNNNASCSKIVANQLTIAGNVITTLNAGTYYLTKMSITGNAKVNINSTLGPVKVILDGAGPFTFTGNGVVNPTNMTRNLSIISNSATTITLSGNNTFAGAIYAPKATVARSGNAELYGSVLGYIVTSSGNSGVHFDASLISQFGGNANGNTIPVTIDRTVWNYGGV